MTKRNLTKGRSMKPRPLLLNPERKYKYLCEEGSAAMMMLGADGKVIDANNALLEMSGYLRDEVVGKNALDFVVPEQRKKTAAQIQAALINGAAPQFEVAFRSKDGSTRTLLLPPKQLVLEEEGQRSFLVMGVDITERKRIEETLRNDEEEYRELAESITDVFFAVDRHLRYTYWNKASENLTGISAKDAIGKSLYELFPDVKGTSAEEVYLEVLRTGQSKSFVNEYKLNGRQFFFEISAYPTKWGISVFTIDITERKRMEDALRVSEENFRTLAENAFDGIITVAGEGVFVFANERAAEITGYSVAELLGATIKDLVHPDEFEKTSERYRRRLEGGAAPSSYETVIIRKDGRSAPVELAATRTIWQRNPADLVFFRDITERKRMEEALRRYSTQLEELVAERTGKLTESERRFRELSDLLPQIVYEADVKGNFLFLNQAGLDQVGYSQEEMAKGLNISQLFVSDDMDRGFENLRRKLSGEEFGGAEYTMLRKDGTPFPILNYSSPIFRDDKVMGLRGVAIDITERKRAEIELRAAKERLDYVITSNPAVIFTAKPRADYSDFNIAYMSDRVVEMLGFEPRQFIDHPEFWDGRVHPDDLRRYPMEVAELWKKGDCAFEYRFLHKDGTYRWIREEAKVIRDAAGKPVEIMGYWTDVTERKRKEDTLQTRERQLSAIYSNVSDVLFLLSVEPDNRFRFLSINQTFLDTTGLRENQIVGRDVREVIPEPSLGLVLENYRQAIRDKKAMRWEEVTDYPSGRKCGEVSVTPILDENGRCTNLLGTVHDITEVRKIEQQLVKSERLAAIGQIAAMVGHDLRNPFQGITGAAYNIRKHLQNAPDPSTKEMLAVIDNGIEYANGIINDLLEFSREMQLQPVPTTPKSMVKQTLTDVKIPNNITIEDTTADAPEILADEPKLKRVLFNLIENAINAMPEGGKLSVSSMNTQQEVSISVHDTGVGIPQDMVEKIWTPLYTTKAKGIGLGLPICKRFAEAHGGSISVQSTVGKGTTFTLKLPIQEVQGGELS